MQLSRASIDRDLKEAVDHIVAGFSELRVHPDVPEGLRRLADLGVRLVTLTNGSSTIAQRLLSEAGVEHCFESFLSVEQAGVWKPAREAYGYALEHCGVVAADAMLVAAHPRDTDGARRAGWCPPGSTEPEGDTRRTSWRPIWRWRRWSTSRNSLTSAARKKAAIPPIRQAA